MTFRLIALTAFIVSLVALDVVAAELPAVPSAGTTAVASAESTAPPTSALRDPVTRIEQVRRGRRVTEVIVSPGGYTHRYVMVNRDLRAPIGPSESVGGLSVPRFVRIDF